MSVISVTGGHKLRGNIRLHGAKNSALPILAATALCSGESVIHNCPALSDVDSAIKILRHLGAVVKKENSTVIVNSDNINKFSIPDELMREMRSSIVFLGAICARMNKAILSSPGGCELGPRPIDLHLSSLKELGLEIVENHGLLECNTNGGLRGADITLSFPSVGATENIILAAATAEGITRIHNPAREPEISDLADFLNRAGAMVQGAGSDTIEIIGVKRLKGTEHSVIPDRIEAATYLACAAVTEGKLTITGKVAGNTIASEIYVNTPRLEGDINSRGIVKIDVGTVVIGSISCTSVLVAGAVKGNIEVNGPVIVDSTAVVKGDIKAKSIQINSGAVIDGHCSLAYADVDLDSFFE